MRAALWALAAALSVVAVAGLLYGAAHLLTDHSGVARAVVWHDADVGDHERFPARRIEAPARSARLKRDPIDLDGVAVAGRPLVEMLDASQTAAFIVLRDGAVAYERYFDGHRRDSIQTSFSVAKSFASTLIGIAIADGEIESVGEPITDYLPELAERDPGFERIRIEHLMAMTSGLRYEEGGLPWSDDAQTYYGTDLRDLALTDTEIVEPPGSRWHYNNFNPLLAGMVLERATGMPVADYLERELWQPLGAEHDASWSVDSADSGFEKMESGLNATAIDFARLGLLYLHDGTWRGRRIVPSEWVRASTSPVPGSPGYGYWWWTEPDGAFSARGNLGQFVFVDPQRKLVIVRFGADSGGIDWQSAFREVARAVG
jgi:CubicO group peptidase (beta-lactamase class C family)